MAKEKTDQQTLNLIEAVNKQKAEIAKLDKPNWKTNCSFCYNEGSNNSVNLHVENSVSKLVNIAAFLLSREQSYAGAAALMGVEAPTFSWDGSSLDDWLDDIKLRISKIQIASKKKKLETLESRLNAIISPELRAQLELESIHKELNS